VRLERRGEFDTWIGYENNNAQYDCWVRGHDWSGEEVERYKLGGYETDKLTDLLSRTPRLEMPRHRSFSVLAFQPPHSPYVAPETFVEHYDPTRIDLRPNISPVERVIAESRESPAG
tara:strand:- start:3172 stop:3522 length:351 start_codon:yes stop_codon:yes gene_type:complete